MLIAYFVPSPNGEDSLIISLSPEPDIDPNHLRGGTSHMHIPSGVTKIKSIEALLFELRVPTDIHTDRQTDRQT